jgi:hypothetical protein
LFGVAAILWVFVEEITVSPPRFEPLNRIARLPRFTGINEFAMGSQCRGFAPIDLESLVSASRRSALCSETFPTQDWDCTKVLGV